MTKSLAAIVVPLALLTASACKNAPRQGGQVRATDSIAPAHRSVMVSTTADLLPALKAAAAGTTVLLQPGEYEISRTLVIPDGVTLLGSGAMKLDAQGRLPTGFDPWTRTVVKSAPGLEGDVLVLGNRSAVRGLAIEDAAGASSNNIVVVHSRHAGDVVTATLEDCEILSRNTEGGARRGVIIGSVVAATAAPTSRAGADSSTKLGESVALRMSHCIVHSPVGGGVFATNFASRGRVNVLLTENIIRGGLIASGGASRAYTVSGASTVIESRGNVFRADSGTPPTIPGWLVSAVATPPDPRVPADAATMDTLHVRSIGDRIEGFQTAISASGALRLRPDAEVLSGNVATLELKQTELRSVTADLDFAGARSLAAGAFPDSGNVLRLIASGVTGSGARGNAYVVTSGPAGTSWRSGNRVEVVGSLNAFARMNRGVTPPPTRQFFTAASNGVRTAVR
jgi:hypothetical protein